jgi:hypothetical protein
MYLYDAVYLYLLTVQRIVNGGGDYRNGSLVFENSVGINFNGERFTGDVTTWHNVLEFLS